VALARFEALGFAADGAQTPRILAPNFGPVTAQ
jgi:hypothetical protein